MTPISARSYQEKKITINQQLERTLNQMKTPTASEIGQGLLSGQRLMGITPTGATGTKAFGSMTPSQQVISKIMQARADKEK